MSEPGINQADIKRSIKARRQLIGGWIVIVGFLVWLNAANYNEHRVLQALTSRGVVTNASVIAKHESGTKHTTYYVDTVFAAEGQVISHTFTVTGDQYYPVGYGHPLAITYLSGDPSVCRAGVINANSVRSSEQSWIGLDIVAVVVALAVYLRTWFMRRRNATL